MAKWIPYNPNPSRNRVDDCMLRAICAVTGADWKTVHVELCALSYSLDDVQVGNHTWYVYMRRHGFSLHGIPNTCPECYTVGDFADDHPTGAYLLGTGSHAVAVIDGNVLDTFDSRQETPIYYYVKEDA